MIHYFFNKAQYRENEDVVLVSEGTQTNAKVSVFELSDVVNADITIYNDKIVISNLCEGNYGVRIEDEGEIFEGAFDVTKSARSITRYGFLADFSAEDTDEEDVKWMRDLHLNAVQFYDWMYRHDKMVPDTDEYEDPLGRTMSLSAVRKKIALCKEMGIRPFAYGAIYAASKQFFEEHKDWGMYTLDGEPMLFADWLNFMNVEEGCGWTEHLSNEYKSAIKLGFKGIHMDTYGFPKHVWNAAGKKVSLEEEFPKLINMAEKAVEEVDSEAGVIFNAVNDWPTEYVAVSLQDSVYIEVWPPHDTYYDLHELIRKARLYSGKNVVLAAYLHPFDGALAAEAMWTFRLAWASISASCGTQLVLGEYKSLLKDSYYVNYANVDENSCSVIQRYCDFLVRYAKLLYLDKGTDISKTASCGINEDICFDLGGAEISPNGESDKVWTLIRESATMISVNLVNLCGNDNKWNELKKSPAVVSNMTISFRLDREIKGIYSASPDEQYIAPKVLPFAMEKTSQGRIYKVKVDELICWKTIWVEID